MIKIVLVWWKNIRYFVKKSDYGKRDDLFND